ncbi:TetR/AcrR family transcriptional regulator [Isoptericola sp. b490]|uniref:TetR/AcrR family transcriptional regulator n=1 Tax=Actinotalea lenta TaxID=3064654 RepID=UPI002713D996|nr:TetR/AcrR family transcriptional regulator [Isoptericola sp. b490]MDO8120736.1 TetR/AcrR family transcriptional regulator [Isoptericola sp. b490]
MLDDARAPRRPGGHGSGRGRPRDPELDRRVLETTLGLLAEVGYGGLTVAEVARRAQVGKPAVYRRWAGKSQLVVEALVTQLRPQGDVGAGSVVEDLTGLIGELVHLLTRTPLGRVLPGLVSEMATDPVLAESYRRLIIGPNQQRWWSAVERGIGRGELVAETDVDAVVNALAGPLYLRVLITGEPVPDDYAATAVGMVLARYGATAPHSRPMEKEG